MSRRRRRVFAIETPEAAAPAPAPAPAGPGPMAAAIRETAGAAGARAAREAEIRAENDALAHEHARLRRLGLVVDLVPVAAIAATRLSRDRAAGAADPELAELKASIQAVGLSNPIRVTPAGEGAYELVQGFRRLAAWRALRAETGDPAWDAIPAGIIPPGATLDGLYRRMVDENLIRRDVSFAEMAELARAYAGDAAGGDLDLAVNRLYASAGAQKRSYIRAFAALLGRLEGRLAHPYALPRALGLALKARLERAPGAADALVAALDAAPERGAEAELAILRRAAEGKGEGATPARRPRKAARLTLPRPGGEAVCALAEGCLEIRAPLDFAALDRARVETALGDLLAALEAAAER